MGTLLGCRAARIRLRAFGKCVIRVFSIGLLICYAYNRYVRLGVGYVLLGFLTTYELKQTHFLLFCA